MINSTSHQAWLFYSPLALQAALLKDDLLDPVDQLLEDPDLLKLFQQCLAARSPASARTGRPGMAPAAKCLTEANQQRMRDSGVTGARTSNGQAGQAAEAALVPASAALACRL
jgi:hypothetical protein